MVKIILLLVPIVISFLGCVSKGPRVESETSEFQTARWKSEATIFDLKNKKENSIKISIVGEKNHRARLEVTALLGYPVASVVLQKDAIKAALHTQKQFIFGDADSETINRILKVNLTSIEILQILFDQNLSPQRWKCDSSSAKKVSLCQSLKTNTQIRWVERADLQKKIVIESSRIKVEWSFDVPQTSVEVKEALFRLEPLPGYKTIQIN